MTVKVGINGFGRIGRNFFRAALESSGQVEIVGVNDLASIDVLAHMLKYDSVLGPLKAEVSTGGGVLSVGGSSVRATAETDPSKLPWGDLGADVVIESTGRFTKAADARQHLAAGARKVIISAPAKDEDITIVMGVNDHKYDMEKHHIISNASCTTNCVAPMVKVLLENFGIVSGMMTTVHAYTSEQQLLDQIALTRKGTVDLRRARAAGLNITPTSTGAAQATSLVIPEVEGKLRGMAFRVPVPTGSVTDLVVQVERQITAEEINAAFKAAADGPLKGILAYTEDEIVSSDIVHSAASATIDGKLTTVNNHQVKVVGWYDNEWGYSSRLVEVAQLVGR
ncbi:type I glyceraldehyde-3-phosphate dehydrogenase [Actinoplanes sp. NPDC020271]|uniref:type I glyceraldehyde-3-phosphate dehydrogenase n=1 Tax=Actinoplanes sp. NPDC020271 TaxID=3363896 RepID=UPI00379EB71A